MTGLKSGSGDDLWGDEPVDEGEKDTTTSEPESESESTTTAEQTDKTADTPAKSPSSTRTEGPDSTGQEQPYIVRRAIQDKSVQFERDERLTFFVHDDVIEGERQLLTNVETAFGRDVPKFDVREAVYRAALQNQDDVLNELIEMGYSPNTE
ncbi:hypothetical protein [Halalkalicoccus sp. NIPERK01]|uniref:hypothetical protein n=1 Tax=Halalkalicoccus sp. NIPERK01 TaxID=3053469 RepID=UPI00256F6298|nr:hypothetical protein [Halalkalicoccus sp. NIPERK01]MDL5363232.1 hypothetical protein [Halalkalicoccus sp. NIPERK01]